MEVAQAIKYGIPGMLRANEHQILYEIESRLHDCSTEHEEYMTFWIASHKDHETATDTRRDNHSKKILCALVRPHPSLS